jgi:hypothetical protein
MLMIGSHLPVTLGRADFDKPVESGAANRFIDVGGIAARSDSQRLSLRDMATPIAGARL